MIIKVSNFKKLKKSSNNSKRKESIVRFAGILDYKEGGRIKKELMSERRVF